MWRVEMIFLCCVLAPVASQDIIVKCELSNELPQRVNMTPSVLRSLRAEEVISEGTKKINISWAIHNDVTVRYLTGLRIVGSLGYNCKYISRLTESAFNGNNERWFYALLSEFAGNFLQASNLPLPLMGDSVSYISTNLVLLPSTSPHPSTALNVSMPTPSAVVTDREIPITSIVVAIFGGLAGLMILGSFYIIYKYCRTSFSSSLGFEKLAPVSVLVVYPPENPAFQRAVVALAEFLQWHGGCSVAIDLWQQGKIAELGPIRWLAEQVKAAERVLIICPPANNHSSKSSDYSPLFNHSCPESSIPAAARDLYPLILNTVASHAKSADELAKFWVVCLGEQQGNRLSNLAPELRACKRFSLMKDLNKLCLFSNSNPLFRSGLGYNEKTTFKLRDVIENQMYSKEPVESSVVTV